jgi:hypothetical protein
MRLPFLLSSLFVLGALGQAAAQGTSSPSVSVQDINSSVSTEFVTPYTTERDSLWRRAERVRARTQARIALFRKSSFAVRGTRRKVESYALLKAKSGSSSVRYVRIKREISKHKTAGAEIEKRFYYGLAGRLLLAEYYEGQQLVRLELQEYPVREGSEYGTVFREMQWLRGDYLHLITHEQENRGKSKHYYYTEERAPR